VDRVLDEEEVIEAAINADVDDVEVCVLILQSPSLAALLVHNYYSVIGCLNMVKISSNTRHT
jgi:hypothetical protein